MSTKQAISENMSTKQVISMLSRIIRGQSTGGWSLRAFYAVVDFVHVLLNFEEEKKIRPS
jgi:hypothetical protein